MTLGHFGAGALTAFLTGGIIVGFGPEVALTCLVGLLMAASTALVVIDELDTREEDKRLAERRERDAWNE